MSWVAPVYAAAPAPDEARQSYARVILNVGGKTYPHPGFFAYVGEESTFNFEIGGKVHEVVVGIQGDDENGYDLIVRYKLGQKILLEGTGHVAPGKSLKIEKAGATVEVIVDPQGSVDRKRRKKIDGPGSDDPMG